MCKMVCTSSGLLALDSCPCVYQLDCKSFEGRNHILDFFISFPFLHVTNTSCTQPRSTPLRGVTGDTPTVLNHVLPLLNMVGLCLPIQSPPKLPPILSFSPNEARSKNGKRSKHHPAQSSHFTSMETEATEEN